jgi:hypothetical protein
MDGAGRAHKSRKGEHPASSPRLDTAKALSVHHGAESRCDSVAA